VPGPSCGRASEPVDELGQRGAHAFGAFTLGELTRCDYSKYPNVNRWIGTMKQLKSWAKVSEVVYGFAGSLKGQSFVTI